MQEVFEKIIGKLVNKRKTVEQLIMENPQDELDKIQTQAAEDFASAYGEAIEIVKQEAEKFGTDNNVGSNGWITCSEHPPKECVPVNVTWINRNPESYYAKIKDVPFSATAVYYNSKWYWYSSTCVDYLSEYGENAFDLVDKDIDIIAWQPLPKPYQPKKDRANCKNRHENGNCLAIGGFCTSVDDKYCKYQPKGE